MKTPENVEDVITADHLDKSKEGQSGHQDGHELAKGCDVILRVLARLIGIKPAGVVDPTTEGFDIEG